MPEINLKVTLYQTKLLTDAKDKSSIKLNGIVELWLHIDSIITLSTFKL
jgi:hypothetical protein